MRRVIILLLFATAVLAGCAPAGSATTVDAYVMVEQAQRTAEAAADEANFYGSQLTATAQAPIIKMTQDVAALYLNQQYWTATMQWIGTATSAPLTATAQSWTPTVTSTPTANATTTLVAVNAAATQAFVQNDIKRDDMSVERTQSVNYAIAFLPPFAIFLAIIVAVMFGIVMAKKLAVQPNPVDARGNPLPMFDVVEGTAWDMDRSVNGMISTKQSYLKHLPEVTAQRQDDVTNRDQLVDLRTRSASMRKLEASLQKQLPAPVASNEAPANLFPQPDWEIVDGWDRANKDMLPCGASSKGLDHWDLRTYPHIAVFGKTRSGKDYRFLRPLITFMLASNQRVILIGKTSDFVPFIGHPNAMFVPIFDITERGEAEKYANALAVCVEEKNRRIRQMTEQGLALWPHERTFIILDELGNAMIEMDSDLADMTMRKARSIVNEGAKAGLGLVFSAQRPKGFVDLTTQCGRAVFQVETDTERGYALGMKGADKLPEIPTGYFYKKLGALQLTGAFEPSDDDISAYLHRSDPKVLEKADWIEGMIKPMDVKQVTAETDAGLLPDIKPFSNEVVEMAEKIRKDWHPGLSKSEVSRMFSSKPYAGSSWTSRISAVIEYLTSTSTTTAENGQNSPFLGAVEA
jgi:hypothetical protein